MKKDLHLMILLIAAVVVFLIYNVTALESEISHNHYNNLTNNLSNLNNDFGIWISNKKDMLNTTTDIINNFTYDEIVVEKTGNLYLNINNEVLDVSQVYVGLADGGFITGGQWIPPEDYDPRTRVWYKEAVDADDIIVSKTYVDMETGKLLVTISGPLYIEEKFVGVISADIFLENIRDYLKEQIKEDNSYIYLVDQDGLLIVHTSRESLVGKNIYTDVKDKSLVEYFEQAKRNPEIVLMEYDFGEQNVRGIFQKVRGGNWYLAVAMVYNKSLIDVGAMNSNNRIINGFLFVIITILIYLLIKRKFELDNRNRLLVSENEKDFLTGIYNRRYFDLYMEKLWKPENKVKSVSLLMLDVDKFKEYNDTYGHSQGDVLLKEMIECISERVRNEDVLARYGGEEFTLTLTDISPDLAYNIGSKIMDAVYDLKIEHKNYEKGRVTISIGITTVDPKENITVLEVIDQADSALYKAKDSGRNAIVRYSSDNN